MTSFYETFGLKDWLRQRFAGGRVFINQKSRPVRFAEAAMKLLGLRFAEATELATGSIPVATGLRQAAWDHARAALEKMGIRKWQWTREVSELFAIDFALIVEKYYFDELYRKYIFLELALAYCKLNPALDCRLSLDARFLEPYEGRVSNIDKLGIRGGWSFLAFIQGLFLIPALLLQYRWSNGAGPAPAYSGEIVCQVDDRSTYEMFSSIFGPSRRVRYVVERHNAARYFDRNALQSFGIAILGLTDAGFSLLARKLPGYVGCSLGNLGEIARHGSDIAWIFHALLRGKGEVIEGEGSTFVCYEHFTTVKAARNEFLHASRNRSIFIPKNCYVTYQQFHSEIFVNYSAMCVSGAHAIDVYAKREARTTAFIESGSYYVHRNREADGSRAARIRSLADYRGASTLVVFLSPGVCEENLSHDRRLIELAARLGQRSDIKVAVRMKPSAGTPGYVEFYAGILANSPNVLLTGPEYELFDFAGTADLFVTSQSTSACDLAAVGAQVMFIDFMQTPDLYTPWEKVPATVFGEMRAMEAIDNWIADAGGVRARYADEVRKLSDYVEYKFGSFEAYRANLLNGLNSFLPFARTA